MSEKFNFFNSELLNSRAYQAPKRNQSMMRLDSMEHPFELSKNLIDAMKDSLQSIELNRYPESNLDQLGEKIKAAFNIKDHLQLLFGNGSDELIEMLILASDKNRPVLSFAPSFSMYKILSQTLNRDFLEVDLNAQFQIDLARTLALIAEKNPSLIFIAEPNNPTGQSFDFEAIDQICKNAKGLVVLDEAYFAFSKNAKSKTKNILQLIDHYDNVLVIRTLSKIGFAGIRFGFMIGAKPMIDCIAPLRLPYNINSFNQKLLDVAINHLDEIWQQIDQVCQFRDQMFQALNPIEKIKTYPSDTNFLLIQVAGFSSTDLHQELIGANISTKDLKSVHPLIKDHIRVSMGLAAENQALISELQRIAS